MAIPKVFPKLTNPSAVPAPASAPAAPIRTITPPRTETTTLATVVDRGGQQSVTIKVDRNGGAVIICTAPRHSKLPTNGRSQ